VLKFSSVTQVGLKSLFSISDSPWQQTSTATESHSHIARHHRSDSRQVRSRNCHHSAIITHAYWRHFHCKTM